MKRIFALLMIVVLLVVSGFAQDTTYFSQDEDVAPREPAFGTGNLDRTFLGGHNGTTSIILDTTVTPCWLVTQPIYLRRQSSDPVSKVSLRGGYGLLTIVLTHPVGEDSTAAAEPLTSVHYKIQGAADPSLSFCRLAGAWEGDDEILSTGNPLDVGETFCIPYEQPGGNAIQWWFEVADTLQLKVYDSRWDW